MSWLSKTLFFGSVLAVLSVFTWQAVELFSITAAYFDALNEVLHELD